MATIPWESKLQKLQRSLYAFKEFVGIDFYYGVVHIRDSELGVQDRAEPKIYAAGGTLIESLTVTLNPEEHQLHLMFDTNLVATEVSNVSVDILKRLKSQLGELREILPIIPNRVLPIASIPMIARGIDETFARWGLALIWLGATDQNVFHSTIEFCEASSTFEKSGRVKSWQDASPVPTFNPIEFVTRTGSPDQEWSYWKEKHETDGRLFPEVFAVSLTKPFLYASINAIDLLIQRGHEQRPVQKRVKLQERRIADGSTMTPMETQVLAAYRAHHCRKEGPFFKKISQNVIAKQLNVSQATVHRAMEKILDRINYRKNLTIKQRYAALCKKDLIAAVLDEIENPRLRNELTNSELDFLEGKDR